MAWSVHGDDVEPPQHPDWHKVIPTTSLHSLIRELEDRAEGARILREAALHDGDNTGAALHGVQMDTLVEVRNDLRKLIEEDG